MTNDAIDRAIKRGTGEGDGGTYEAIMYEGYAPGGVALLIDVLTDNRNRTGSEVRNVFTKLGGSMAEPGAVELAVQPARRDPTVDGGVDEDELMLAALDAGADDVARRRRQRGGSRRDAVDRRTTSQARSTTPGSTVELGRHADGVGQPRADHRRSTRRARCCGSSRRSRTTTTCRTSTPTSTSADELMESWRA